MSNDVKRLAQRAIAAFTALVLATGGAVTLLLMSPTQALAYSQVTSRSIQMSSATAGATGTSYLVTFTPATSTTIQALAVDFCSNDPLVGDSCTAPTGFSVGTPTVAVGSIAGETGGTWTAANTNTNRTLTLSNGSASGTPSGTVNFTLSTATNPTQACSTGTTCTFYARIFTFSSTANLTTWSGTTNGSYSGAAILDAGGVALSTTAQISITAKVQEQLTFCTANSTISTCSALTSANLPNLTIGHNGGSGTIILDNSAVDVIPAYTQLSTNAQSGAVIKMKATNVCSNGGLSTNGGTTCNIPGNGSTAVVMTAGTAGFGMCVNKGTNTTVAATYIDSGSTCSTSAFNAASKYGMNGTNLITTYGDQIFSTAGAVNAENNALVFAATAATTTTAGIYSGNESLIATGTF